MLQAPCSTRTAANSSYAADELQTCDNLISAYKSTPTQADVPRTACTLQTHAMDTCIPSIILMSQSYCMAPEQLHRSLLMPFPQQQSHKLQVDKIMLDILSAKDCTALAEKPIQSM